MEDATDGSSGYPASHRIESLRERRLLMSLRVVSIGLFSSLLFNTALVFLIVSLLPLQKTTPFLVKVQDEGSVVASIKPIQDTFRAKDLLTEKLVREYVVNRNEIVRSDAIMKDRWGQNGYLGTTTDQAEYKRFVAKVTPQLDQIRRLGGEIRIKVLSVSAVTSGKVYVVDYRATSYDSNDKVVDEHLYTATLEIAFRPLKNMTKDQLLIDPTGFTVVSQTIADKQQ